MSELQEGAAGQGPAPVPPATTAAEAAPLSGRAARAPGGRGGADPSIAASAAAASREVWEDPVALDKLRQYIESIGGFMHEGWKAVCKRRATGTSAGQTDIYFKAPEGKQFRSRNDVARYLGLAPGGPTPSRAHATHAATPEPQAAAAEAVAPSAPPASDRMPPRRQRKPSAAGMSLLPGGMEPVITRDEAFERAQERIDKLRLKLPLQADRGAIVLALGEVSEGCYTATELWPVGYRAVWVPRAGPSALGLAQQQQQQQADAEDDEGPAAAAAPAASAPSATLHRFLLEVREGAAPAGSGGGEASAEPRPPSFGVSLELAPAPASGSDAASAAPSAGGTAVLCSGKNPDDAWSGVARLQHEAVTACLAAAKGEAGGGGSPTALQRALAGLPPLDSVWGMDCYGLSDVRVLQLVEALPGVETAERYKYVEQRSTGGWEFEVRSINAQRQAVLGMPSPGGARRSGAAGFGASPAPRRRSSGAASARRSGVTSSGRQMTMTEFVVAGQPGVVPPRRSWAPPSDMEEVEAVMDRLLNKVVHYVMTEDERKAKAAARNKKAADRRREKAAELKAAKVAAGLAVRDRKPVSPETSARIAAKAREREARRRAKAGGDGTSAPEGEAAPAVHVSAVLAGGPADERALASADQPPPPPLALEAAIAEASLSLMAHDGQPQPKMEPGSTGAGALGVAEIQQLLHIYQFLFDFRKLLGLEGRVPSLGDLLQLVAAPPGDLPAGARRLSEEVHTGLVRLLVGEAFEELVGTMATTSNLTRRDLSPATPPVTPFTWPELARRYLAAAAAARYLATSEPRSSALVPLQLPGQLPNLEPADWLHYLLGGLNFPHLLSRIALLPRASSKTAAEALLAGDDARARAAAERQLQGAGAPTMALLDGDGQVRRGRRLLQALLSLPPPDPEAGPKSGGLRLGFYAVEFGEALRAPRGLDLHSVAVRLDAGLYQCTGQWLDAMAADVRSALSLWRAALNSSKAKAIPGHELLMASLADQADQALASILAHPDTELDLATRPQPPKEPPPAPPPPPQPPADGEGEGGEEAKHQAEAAAAAAEQQQQEQQQQEAAEEEAQDPHALDDPCRLFNPREGCRVCWQSEDDGRILLCDSCDGEYHCYCVEPPLLEVPEGHWYCPACTARGIGLQQALQSPRVKRESLGGDDQPGSARRGPAAAAAAGKPAQASGGSLGLEARSPAFQHRHSHAELSYSGRRVHGGEAANALHHHGVVVPDDVPEGPRVPETGGGPGLEEVRNLLRIAQLLGESDYLTGGGSLAAAAAAPGQGAAQAGSGPGGRARWGPSQRLALLAALCDLAADTNALRGYLDETTEARKKARADAMALRAKARQLQEEQLLAAKRQAAERDAAGKVQQQQPQQSDQKPQEGGEQPAEAAQAAPDGDAGTAAAAAAQPAEAGPVPSEGAAGPSGAGTNPKDKEREREKERVRRGPGRPPGSGRGRGRGGGRGGRGGRGDRDKAADEEGGEGAGAGGDDDGEGGHKSKRPRIGATDLSLLTEAEVRRLADLEAQMESSRVRQECLGEDRHGNRYWWLGAEPITASSSSTGMPAQAGCVFVELLPTGAAAAAEAAAAAAFAARQELKRRQRREMRAAARARKAAAAAAAGESGQQQPGDGSSSPMDVDAHPGAAASPPAADADAAPANAANPAGAAAPRAHGDDSSSDSEEELDDFGRPKYRPPPLELRIGLDSPSGSSWGAYHTLEQLNALLAWLHPKGVREGALRGELLKARDRIAAASSAPPPAQLAPAADGEQPPTEPQQAPAQQQPDGSQGQQQGAVHADADAGSVGQATAPVSSGLPLLQLQAVLAPAPASRGGKAGAGDTADGAAAEPAAAALDGAPQAGGAAASEPGAPCSAASQAGEIRAELLQLYRGLPEEAFSAFWGSSPRRAKWEAFVAAATAPQQLCAAMTVLEAMLVDEALRPHWRLWCMPAQHPDLCRTWAAAHFRLLGLTHAVRKQDIKGLKIKGMKQQDGERYPSRARGPAPPAPAGLAELAMGKGREAAALLASNQQLVGAAAPRAAPPAAPAAQPPAAGSKRKSVGAAAGGKRRRGDDAQAADDDDGDYVSGAEFDEPEEAGPSKKKRGHEAHSDDVSGEANDGSDDGRKGKSAGKKRSEARRTRGSDAAAAVPPAPAAAKGLKVKLKLTHGSAAAGGTKAAATERASPDDPALEDDIDEPAPPPPAAAPKPKPSIKPVAPLATKRSLADWSDDEEEDEDGQAAAKRPANGHSKDKPVVKPAAKDRERPPRDSGGLQAKVDEPPTGIAAIGSRTRGKIGAPTAKPSLASRASRPSPSHRLRGTTDYDDDVDDFDDLNT